MQKIENCNTDDVKTDMFTTSPNFKIEKKYLFTKGDLFWNSSTVMYLFRLLGLTPTCKYLFLKTNYCHRF